MFLKLWRDGESYDEMKKRSIMVVIIEAGLAYHLYPYLNLPSPAIRNIHFSLCSLNHNSDSKRAIWRKYVTRLLTIIITYIYLGKVCNVVLGIDVFTLLTTSIDYYILSYTGFIDRFILALYVKYHEILGNAYVIVCDDTHNYDSISEYPYRSTA